MSDLLRSIHLHLSANLPLGHNTLYKKFYTVATIVVWGSTNNGVFRVK